MDFYIMSRSVNGYLLISTCN